MAIAFPLLLVGMLGASEWLVRTRVVPHDSTAAHIERLLSPTTPNAIFGDSHTLRLVGMPGFVNLSRGGESVRTMEAKVRRYYATMAPGDVVLHADPNQFAPGYPNDDGNGPPAPFEPSSPALHVLSPDYRGFIADYWRRFLTGQGFEPSLTLHPDGAITDPAVWPDAYPSPEQRRRIAETSVAAQTPIEDIASSPSGVAYARLMGFLVGRGGNVCLVVMPHSSEYLALEQAHPTFAEAHAYVVEVADEYDLTLVDLTSAFADQSLFADEDHLNERGGRMAGAIVEERCFGA